MGRTQSRVMARRVVHEAQLQRRRAQAARDKKLQALAVEVQVALADGHAKLRAAEVEAGQAIERMITEFGLSPADVSGWCCGTVTVRGITRLRRLAAEMAGSAD